MWVIDRMLRLLRAVPAAVLLAALCSCGKEEIRKAEFLIRPEGLVTRAVIPDEWRINDVNFFVFDEDGLLILRKYVSARQNQSGKAVSISVDLPRGVDVTIACCANLGYELDRIRTLAQLKEQRYYLAYADEFRNGLPMATVDTRIWEDCLGRIDFPLKRLVSKISLSVDRSGLDAGVTFKVVSASLKNIPRSASLEEGSRARNRQDVFTEGYTLGGREADALNSDESPGISRELCLYMLENLQGDLLEDTVDDRGKVLEGPQADVCSYVELKVEYMGGALHSADGPLVYRFYVGEDNSNFDARRNCHYHFRVCPMGDGLGDDGWRLDKSSLTGY